MKGKTAEEILALDNTAYADVGTYLRVAVQVRSTQELIAQLKTASDDSANTARKIVYLTLALVGAAILQAVATGWPYLTWWANHRLRFSIF